MLYAAIDIHKHAFQAAVLDADSGEVVEERFSADRESLARWAGQWRGRVGAVAIEATTGWRWVWRELAARGFEVRLAEERAERVRNGVVRLAEAADEDAEADGDHQHPRLVLGTPRPADQAGEDERPADE